MDDQLKDLMRELGNAINESLSESERISAVIEEIKEAGYEVFLVLEATIGFNKCESSRAAESSEGGGEQEPCEPERSGASKIRWTSHDQKFLRALKIAVDDDRV
ncbi:MAG: hypothetical protein ACUVXB_03415 [Bryobacteraceae bacterium]